MQKLKGETLEKAVERADYREIWEVLQALSEYDESLEATIRNLTQEKGQTGVISKNLEDYIEIIAHDTVDIALQKKLAKKIDVLIIEKLGNSWDEMFGRLFKFKDQYHHCNVPQGFKQDTALANWVNAQRNNYKKQQLSSDKIQQLESIGFEWDPIKTQWQLMFEKLLQFKGQHHHCNVTRSFQKNPELASWANIQRKRYKKQQLSSDRVQQLESIGFEWDPYNIQWQQVFEKLLQFKEQYHHCNVPKGFQPNLALAGWVNTQRSSHRKKQLSSDRVQQLESIGFEWDPINTQWQLMFKKLCQFKEKYHHCNAPQKFKQDPQVAIWINVQRRVYKKQQLPNDKVQQLESIGFEWDPYNTQWQKAFEQLLQFKEQHHHCNVPQRFQRNPVLARWVNAQRNN